jgi:hypothetical protein
MKNLQTLKTQIESIIRDNKEYILDYTEKGNVFEYLHYDFANVDNGHCFYLTSEEIEKWENNEDDRVELINEINDFLKNYDYNLIY